MEGVQLLRFVKRIGATVRPFMWNASPSLRRLWREKLRTSAHHRCRVSGEEREATRRPQVASDDRVRDRCPGSFFAAW
ncbi:hypothetical protein D7W79_26310 [Corallococcus exercitus]|nr:hypothetical protein D7W79_26310 [Corallococcus exercitus]